METEEQKTDIAPDPTISGETYVTTLNLKSMDCDPRACFAHKTVENPRGITPLAKIFGSAISLKYGENRRDSTLWTALSGDFTGVNLVTGKMYNSGKLFLPPGIQDIVEKSVVEIQRLIEQKRVVEGAMAVDFAFQINTKTADNPIGYTYEAVNLMPPTQRTVRNPLRDWVLKGIPMPQEEPVKQLTAPQTASTEQAASTEQTQTPLQQNVQQHKGRGR